MIFLHDLDVPFKENVSNIENVALSRYSLHLRFCDVYSDSEVQIQFSIKYFFYLFQIHWTLDTFLPSDTYFKIKHQER